MARKLTKTQTGWLKIAAADRDGEVEIGAGRRKGTAYRGLWHRSRWPRGAEAMVDAGLLEFVTAEKTNLSRARPWFSFVFAITDAGRALAATL